MSLILPPRLQRERALRLQREQIGKHTEHLLQQHYPEHLFTVEVPANAGGMFIDHPLMSKAKGRMFLKFDDYNHGKGAVRVAGEILERVGLKRGELEAYEEYDQVDDLAQTAFATR